eukprot:SAG31_NODE_1349_length_8691_cov_6.407239_9_plen_58_part_00
MLDLAAAVLVLVALAAAAAPRPRPLGGGGPPAATGFAPELGSERAALGLERVRVECE